MPAHQQAAGVSGNYIDQRMTPKFLNLILAQLVLSFLLSCDNNNPQNDNVYSPKDSVENSKDTSKIAKEIVDTISVTSSSQIVGTWESLGKEPLLVKITKDKIFYKEHNESHSFKIKSDSIYIHYFDYTLSGRPYLLNDTFVIELANHIGENKYLSRKK